MGILFAYEAWSSEQSGKQIGLDVLKYAVFRYPQLSVAKLSLPNLESEISISADKIGSHLEHLRGTWSIGLINRKNLVKSAMLTTSVPYLTIYISGSSGRLYLYEINNLEFTDIHRTLINIVGIGVGYIAAFYNPIESIVYSTEFRSVSLGQLRTYLDKPKISEWHDRTFTPDLISEIRDIYSINLWPTSLVQLMKSNNQCEQFLRSIPGDRNYDLGNGMEVWNFHEREIIKARNIMRDFVFVPQRI